MLFFTCFKLIFGQVRARLVLLCLFCLTVQQMATKGVERIETAEGDDFDPNTQEAMTTMPAADGKQPNTVANVWQVSICWAARLHMVVLSLSVAAQDTSSTLLAGTKRGTRCCQLTALSN